jgi:competence protein CoiA
MQVYALNQNGKRIFAGSALRSEEYQCLECGLKVRVRKGLHRRAHFYHVSGQKSCRQSGKTKEHLDLQALLVTLLAPDADEEVAFSAIGRIADVACEKERIIFEIQCSPISAEEVKARIRDYESVGWRVIWILSSRTFSKYRASEAEVALLPHPHYFAKGGRIFDELSDIVGGVRRRRSERAFIDEILLEAMPPESNSCPKPFNERLKHWKYHLKGDLIDKVRGSREFRLFSQNSLSWNKKKFISTLKGLYYFFLERSCR